MNFEQQVKHKSVANRGQKSVSNNTYSPFTGIKNLPKEETQYKFLNKSEMSMLLSHARSADIYEFYLTALYTGMRRGELAGLCWDCVDFTSNIIVVRRTRDQKGLYESTKSKRIRYIPMHPILKTSFKSLLKEQRNPRFVFSNRSGEPIAVHHLYRKFRVDQTEAGIDTPIRFHDLRHTFASQFMMNSGSIYDLQKILGHSDLLMTQRYAHHSPEHLQGSLKYFGFGEEEKPEKFLSILKS